MGTVTTARFWRRRGGEERSSAEVGNTYNRTDRLTSSSTNRLGARGQSTCRDLADHIQLTWCKDVVEVGSSVRNSKPVYVAEEFVPNCLVFPICSVQELHVQWFLEMSAAYEIVLAV